MKIKVDISSKHFTSFGEYGKYLKQVHNIQNLYTYTSYQSEHGVRYIKMDVIRHTMTGGERRMNSYEKLMSENFKKFQQLPIKYPTNNKQYMAMMLEWGLNPAEKTDKVIPVFGGFALRVDLDTIMDTYCAINISMQSAMEADVTGDGFCYEMFLTELRNMEYEKTHDLAPTLQKLGYTGIDILNDDKLKHSLAKAVETITGDKIG